MSDPKICRSHHRHTGDRCIKLQGHQDDHSAPHEGPNGIETLLWKRGQAPVRCICEWESGCAGTGVIHCMGCGGDQCICAVHHGGEETCPGCEACRGGEEGDGHEYWEPPTDEPGPEGAQPLFRVNRKMTQTGKPRG